MGSRYEKTEAPPSAIREMTSQRDQFLKRVRKQWEDEREHLGEKESAGG